MTTINENKRYLGRDLNLVPPEQEFRKFFFLVSLGGVRLSSLVTSATVGLL
jgi:hypothetical protein